MLSRVLSRGMATASAGKSVLVVGGSGALGRACVDTFKDADWSVISADVVANDNADANVLAEGDWKSQVERLMKSSPEGGLGAVICTAGGWAGGSLAQPAEAVEGAEAMIEACYKTALSSTLAAYGLLRPDGLLVLTGAAAALGPTPSMVGYGMAKAATGFLAQCAASPSEAGGLPDGCHVTVIAPGVLDSQANRDAMPDVDVGTLTPPAVIAELLLSRAEGGEGRRGATRGEVLVPATDGGVTTWQKRA